MQLIALPSLHSASRRPVDVTQVVAILLVNQANANTSQINIKQRQPSIHARFCTRSGGKKSVGTNTYEKSTRWGRDRQRPGTFVLWLDSRASRGLLFLPEIVMRWIGILGVVGFPLLG